MNRYIGVALLSNVRKKYFSMTRTFPQAVIILADRPDLRFGPSYSNVEELPSER